MTRRTWLITGVSSGFGRELTAQLLDRGERVVGTVRRRDAVADLAQRYPETFRVELLDVTDTAAVRDVVDRSVAALGRIDVVVSNAGYGLFGAERVRQVHSWWIMRDPAGLLFCVIPEEPGRLNDDNAQRWD